MRRGLRSVALFCSLALVASGCATGEGDGSKGEIRIGVSIELSGAGAAIGPAHKNSLNLVAEEINRRGGIDGQRLKLIIKDNKSDPAEALDRVKDFIDNDDVSAIIGGGMSTTTLSTIAEAENRRVPMVSLASSDDITTPANQRRFIFKTAPSPAPVVDVMLREFRTKGFDRIGLLAVSDAYGEAGVKGVKLGVQREGLTLVGTERFGAADQDYSTQLTKLIAKQPDAIIVWSIMPGASRAARNIQDLSYSGNVYFDAGAGAELFLRDGNVAGEDLYMVHPQVLAANQITATTPSALAQKEFFTRYTQKYGTFSGFASYSADALNLLVAAIRQAGSSNNQLVRNALEKMEFDGLTGSFRFTPADHGGVAGDALTVLTVRSGGWVLAQ